MLRVLLKKQIAEVFKSYFYDAKKNKMRSKWAIAAWIVFFVVIMVGVLGGMFTSLSLALCAPLAAVRMGWLYFLLMGSLAILLGVFGSVFNTFSGLYLAKDNDLLLSLPIPVRTIMAARLLNVYLLGTMYTAVVMLPALIVCWVLRGVTVSRVICGLLLFLTVTLIVLLLSCLLGWVVAQISLRLRNKSFITVFIALAFFGAYYFFYFKAADIIRDIIVRAAFFGAKIQGAAYGLYLFGRIGEGDWTAAAITTGGTLLLCALLWFVMERSFLRIVTSSGRTGKQRYVEKAAKQRSPFLALLAKEFGRFGSSANYMLNSALGVLIIPVVGVLLLLKGQMATALLDEVFAARPGSAAVLLCAGLSLLSSMICTATPSVSLEGRNLWIPQSLPVPSKTVLRAKLSVELLLTLPVLLFAALAAALVLNDSPAVKLLLVTTALCYAVFKALFGLLLGLRMPLLNWTSELVPIKQSGAMALAILGSFVLSLLFGGLYLLIGWRIGAVRWLLSWTVLFAAASLGLLRRLDTRGAAAFDAL